MADQKRTLDIPSYEAGSPARLPADSTEAGTNGGGKEEVVTQAVAAKPATENRLSLQRHRSDLDPASLDADESVNPNNSSARVRRARVNQHYNEVETGGITGIGRDDAAPLQDVDFELG
jgi:hypothetical protein